MPRKTEEEIKAWLEDENTKQGDKLVTLDEPAPSESVSKVTEEVQKL